MGVNIDTPKMNVLHQSRFNMLTAGQCYRFFLQCCFNDGLALINLTSTVQPQTAG